MASVWCGLGVGFARCVTGLSVARSAGNSTLASSKLLNSMQTVGFSWALMTCAAPPPNWLVVAISMRPVLLAIGFGQKGIYIGFFQRVISVVAFGLHCPQCAIFELTD